MQQQQPPASESQSWAAVITARRASLASSAAVRHRARLSARRLPRRAGTINVRLSMAAAAAFHSSTAAPPSLNATAAVSKGSPEHHQNGQPEQKMTLRKKGAETWVPHDVTDIAVTGDRFEFDCPQCGGPVDVLRPEIQCGIFRHGSLRTNPNERIPPHATKEQCELLLLPWSGCGKPFRFDGTKATPCAYL
jgi:hypothetical protein